METQDDGYGENKTNEDFVLEDHSSPESLQSLMQELQQQLQNDGSYKPPFPGSEVIGSEAPLNENSSLNYHPTTPQTAPLFVGSSPHAHRGEYPINPSMVPSPFIPMFPANATYPMMPTTTSNVSPSTTYGPLGNFVQFLTPPMWKSYDSPSWRRFCDAFLTYRMQGGTAPMGACIHHDVVMVIGILIPLPNNLNFANLSVSYFRSVVNSVQCKVEPGAVSRTFAAVKLKGDPLSAKAIAEFVREYNYLQQITPPTLQPSDGTLAKYFATGILAGNQNSVRNQLVFCRFNDYGLKSYTCLPSFSALHGFTKGLFAAVETVKMVFDGRDTSGI